MRFELVALFAVLACIGSPASAAPSASPYAGQDARAIKSLSPDEVDGYLAGKGMGLAKAAELNGYAGPAHVLELAGPLALTPEQRERTRTLFASMEASARALGRALLEEERQLDRLFASREITPERLAGTLDRIGRLQAKLRGAHLEAHLAQVEILSPEQNALYAQLRGYGSGAAHGVHRGSEPAAIEDGSRPDLRDGAHDGQAGGHRH